MPSFSSCIGNQCIPCAIFKLCRFPNLPPWSVCYIYDHGEKCTSHIEYVYAAMSYLTYCINILCQFYGLVIRAHPGNNVSM